jgi:putative ABC transport system substrate-binding protein
MIGRRDFVTLLGGAAAAWPLAARAQQTAMPVVGVLHGGSAATRTHLLAAFREGLEKTGHIEGQNVAIEYRWADDHNDRLPALAIELVHRQVTVIAAVGGELSALAAKAATSAIPIVFIAGDDPVKVGLVTSLGRPGGNITGVNMFAIELQAKRLGLLNELIAPDLVIAHLEDSNFPPAETTIAEVEKAARALKRTILLLRASSRTDIDAAFVTSLQARVGAILVGAGPFFNGQRNQIVALAARHAIPAMYAFRDSAVAGGLISYGTDIADAYRQAGIYTGRILKGEKPAELPVVQPTTIAHHFIGISLG